MKFDQLDVMKIEVIENVSGVKLQTDFFLSLIGLPLDIVDMTMHFSQNIFHLDQFV